MPCQVFMPADETDLAERNRLTEMLCTTLKSLPPHQIEALPSHVRQWWDKHQADDRRRAEAERREAALLEAKERAELDRLRRKYR